METQNIPKESMFELATQALDFIEDNLTESISVKEVTQRFEKSHWQFQRLFTSVTGVSIGQYLRERRLTEAGRLLQEKKMRLLDVAVLFDFGSEEAFIRSFNSFFGINPGQYSKSEGLVLHESRNKMTREKLSYFWQNVQRTPDIISCSEKTLVGTSIEFKSHFILGSSCHAKIVPHWADFKRRMHLVPERIGDHRIGVVLTSELELREEKLTYFSGVEVTDAKDFLEGMHPVVLPSGTYACFENRTLSENNSSLMDYIYGIWLPSSDYTRGQGFDFEVFDHRYVAGDPNSVSKFHVPVILK